MSSIPPDDSDLSGIAELQAHIAGLLSLTPDDFTVDDDLIMLGLDSLRGMQVFERLRAQGMTATLADLMAEPTVRAWAAAIPKESAAQDDSGEPAVGVCASPGADPHAPFDLAPMQHAYWAGRQPGQRDGGFGAHYYHEFDGPDVDPDRLSAALRALVDRHDMLRVRFTDDGRQYIPAHSPPPHLQVRDLRGRPASTVADTLDTVRADLSHRTLDIAAGEVFDVSLSRCDDFSRLHVNLDMVVSDAMSFRRLLAELAALYDDPAVDLGPIGLSYRAYLAGASARHAADRESDARWWHERIARLPVAPELPTAPSATPTVRTRRLSRWFDAEARRQVEGAARAHGVTPASMLLTCFGHALAGWSRNRHFLVNVPLFGRDQVHPDVSRIVGDFTQSALVEIDLRHPAPFATHAREVLASMSESVSHSAFGGLDVLRALSADRGELVLAPIVFTSALGLGELFSEQFRRCFGSPSWIISQGPQVWLDAQVTEIDGGLMINWDARDDIVEPGVLDAAFAAYCQSIERLAGTDDAWAAPPRPVCTEAMLAVRARVNATTVAVDTTAIYGDFFTAAPSRTHTPAVVCGDTVLTHGELSSRARRVAALLMNQGVTAGAAVVVRLPKGPDQVVAVLGVLAAGAVYVPISVDAPAVRASAVLEQSGATVVLDATLLAQADDIDEPAHPVAVRADDLAYVLFTSGSTGVPKGVEISHGAAANTIAALTNRLNLTAADRSYALSALEFDLSVFDIFSMLSVGGAVVYPENPDSLDPDGWRADLHRHRVTVWNTVPALFDMLITGWSAGNDCGLRVVLLGGDRVGGHLAAPLRRVAPDCRLIALGGMTEAAIHSTFFEIDDPTPDWTTAPWGTPLANVRCRVVDEWGLDRPDHAVGELWMGGTSLAAGYRGMPEQTRARFVVDGGERWYRTGDLARYRPDGTLEFVGRADDQVQIRGHRIEPGEIEAALRSHPLVESAAVAVVSGRRGVSAAVTRSAPDAQPTESALRDWLADRVPDYMVCDRIIVVATLPVTANAKIDRSAVARLCTQAAAHESTAAPVADLSPTLQVVIAACAAVLGTDDPAAPVGPDSNFFALGGNSLLATRVISRLAADGVTGARLSALLEWPVLADFAETLDAAAAADREHPPTPWSSEPAQRLDPFELTPVQAAYLIGRNDDLPLGGVGCHFYREYETARIDVDRLEAAINRVVRRHDMLRAVVVDGRQQVLADPGSFVVTVHDAGGGDLDDAAAQMRAAMAHRVFAPDQWPLFDVRVAAGESRSRIGIGVDNLFLDAYSILLFYTEIDRAYAGADLGDPPQTTYRDCLINLVPTAQRRAADLAYWRDVAATLPPPPDLPTLIAPRQLHGAPFARHRTVVPAATWKSLQDKAGRHEVTASALLLTAFAQVVGEWAASDEFTLNTTLFDRPDGHRDVGRVLGDFTSLLLTDHRHSSNQTIAEVLRATQRTLWTGLDHRGVSGLEVARLAATDAGRRDAAMPVVFTSAIGLDVTEPEPAQSILHDQVWGLSQTPQVWLDHQVLESAGSVIVNWDYVADLMPADMIAEMATAHLALVDGLLRADWDHDVFASDRSLVRRAQRRVAWDSVPDRGCLHDGFFGQAQTHPDKVAVRGDGFALDYATLARDARRVVTALRDRGVAPGAAVAVSVPRGSEQIAAVLGVLAAGAVYVPIGLDQPLARVRRMVSSAQVVLGLVADRRATLARTGIDCVTTDQVADEEPAVQLTESSPQHSAYVIYTSGSTGEPKGVEMTHAAAMNTIGDVRDRFGISGDDVALAVSALEFDLSVFDVFGVLGCGGTLVLIGDDQRRDPDSWQRLISEHGVTVWNSVPALLDMVISVPAAALPSLRVALVSGDRVPTDLASRLAGVAPDCRLYALGGATECAIWSNYFGTPAGGLADFDPRGARPEWASVPYGYPLAGQQFRVLDRHGRDRPQWVPGELWIGGAGLAVGYRGNPAATERAFIVDDGERWYRTGDLGRYRPGGVLEFLGRIDHQVKVAGHRIELGEIDHAIAAQPGVLAGWATVADAGRTIVAAYRDSSVAPADPAAAKAVLTSSPTATTGVEALLCRDVLRDALRIPADAAPGALTAEMVNVVAAEHYRPLLARWQSWLSAVCDVGIADGAETTADDSIRLPVQRLQERRDDVTAILRGDLEPLVLLDDPVLAPERLMAATAGLDDSLAGFAAQIRTAAHELGRTIRIAEIGCRSGLLAARLAELLREVPIVYTLIDTSADLLASARDRLVGVGVAGADIETRRQPAEAIDADLAHRFDVVVAHNVLHTGDRPDDAPTRIRLLGGTDGALVLLTERIELTPLALITAGLLEPGRLDESSRVLDAPSWEAVLTAVGVTDLTCSVRGATATFCGRVPPTDAPRADDVRDRLAGELPPHMVPARLMVTARTPLSGNGKVDRARVADWFVSAADDVVVVEEGPQGPVEELLAREWQTLLRRDAIGRRESFFALGGDSLLATRFIESVAGSHGVTLTLRDFFADPCLAGVAARIEPQYLASSARFATHGLDEGVL